MAWRSIKDTRLLIFEIGVRFLLKALGNFALEDELKFNIFSSFF